MLSHLDCIIFPDRCEVIELVPSQRYVYPIFKNGQTSLVGYAKKYKCKILINEQIKKVKSIDVVLRDPQQRLVSGINTFIQMTLRDYPELDIETVSWFARNYLFLNRHYAPQFFWIVNLARYLGDDTKLNFLSMDHLDQLAKINTKPTGINPITEQLLSQIQSMSLSEMYIRVDQVLVNCIGQSLTFQQLVCLIKQIDPQAYEWTIGRSQRILNPTYVLPKT
jgi:hypothetical protein